MCIRKIVLLSGLLAIFSNNTFAEERSVTALYKVDKIHKISKKVDDKCIDTPAKPCPLMAYWKVYYKALDSTVPRQQHMISANDQLPQVGSIIQLTLALDKK